MVRCPGCDAFHDDLPVCQRAEVARLTRERDDARRHRAQWRRTACKLLNALEELVTAVDSGDPKRIATTLAWARECTSLSEEEERDA